MKKILLIICLVFPFNSVATCNIYTDKYDFFIKKSSEKYLQVHWHYWKAQLAAESGFCDDVINGSRTSSVGAKGIAQFMSTTWIYILKLMHLNESASPSDAKLAIELGAYYMKKLVDSWNTCVKDKGCRTRLEKHLLGVACYNAGCGNLYKAQKEAGGSIRLTEILNNLHKVTGYHSKETLQYVERIQKYKKLYDLK